MRSIQPFLGNRQHPLMAATCLARSQQTWAGLHRDGVHGPGSPSEPSAPSVAAGCVAALGGECIAAPQVTADDYGLLITHNGSLMGYRQIRNDLIALATLGADQASTGRVSEGGAGNGVVLPRKRTEFGFALSVLKGLAITRPTHAAHQPPQQ